MFAPTGKSHTWNKIMHHIPNEVLQSERRKQLNVKKASFTNPYSLSG
jgi:hypothetical protein